MAAHVLAVEGEEARQHLVERGRVETRVAGDLGHGAGAARHQWTQDLVRHGREAVLGEGLAEGCAQIRKRVGEGAVEIEKYGAGGACPVHGCSPPA